MVGFAGDVNQRNLIQGVGGNDIVVIVQHDICVSVVCSQQDLTSLFKDCVNDAGNTVIQCFDGLHCSRHNPGVTDHIGIGEVQDDHVVFVCGDLLKYLVRNLIRTHLRLEIVGRHFRRRHEDPVFSRIRRFHAAVEEERDMSVFLGFCDAQLL